MHAARMHACVCESVFIYVCMSHCSSIKRVEATRDVWIKKVVKSKVVASCNDVNENRLYYFFINIAAICWLPPLY